MRPTAARKVVGVLFLSALVLSVQPARGQSETPTLDALLTGGADAGGINVAGWRFSDFTFGGDGVFALDPHDVGVRFESLGDVESRATVRFVFDTDMQPTQVGNLSLGYRADFDLRGSVTRFGTQLGGSVPLGTFPGTLTVEETTSSLDGSDVAPGAPASNTAILTLLNDGPGPLEDDNSEFTALNVLPGLRLRKDVFINARDAGRPSVVLTDTFLSVPEPSAALVAFPAALALLSRRPRRCVSPARCRRVN